MRYHDITKDDMKNGDGLRVVLWVSGCEHACPGCQNPITWDPDEGLVFDEAAKTELYEALGRDYISGITFSGGDPLFPGNRVVSLELLRSIRKDFPGKTIWLYTGYLWEDICRLEHMRYLDVLVDGPFLERQKDDRLCWKGSKNQRVIDVPRSLAECVSDEGLPVKEPVLHCEDYFYLREEGNYSHAKGCSI
ncbi:MAG: anaerobic ribonucleoside-triphosphate reductase activating protein [Lachnospiraceae bacterium]|nr:anaerobic ribonucleoside-triphosphate reductase activating protein [Lachnospiraceae bacterium]